MQDSSAEDSKYRPYICPCGKNYLSYPALFTHIKQKHNGVPPGQVKRPKIKNKRGRPRKNLNDPLEGHSEPPIISTPLKVQYKNAFQNPLKDKNDSQEQQILKQSAQKIKNQINMSLQFKAPISFAMPRLNNTLRRHAEQRMRAGESVSLQRLRVKLKTLFIPLLLGQFLPSKKLQDLLQMNGCYKNAKKQLKRGRSPSGEYWQMQLCEGIIQFLNWSQRILVCWQFRNLEILMGLLLVFYYQMLPDGQKMTTSNYVTYLNYFAKNTLGEIREDEQYSRVFSLGRGVSISLLSIMHEWFVVNDLTYHEVMVNPHFRQEHLMQLA